MRNRCKTITKKRLAQFFGQKIIIIIIIKKNVVLKKNLGQGLQQPPFGGRGLYITKAKCQYFWALFNLATIIVILMTLLVCTYFILSGFSQKIKDYYYFFLNTFSSKSLVCILWLFFCRRVMSYRMANTSAWWT